MSGRIVYTPKTDRFHECHPGVTFVVNRSTGIRYVHPPRCDEYPKGTVWQCECGLTWVSMGMHPGRTIGSGYTAAALQWKRESWWARRKRLRASVEALGIVSASLGRADVRMKPRPAPKDQGWLKAEDWQAVTKPDEVED